MSNKYKCVICGEIISGSKGTGWIKSKGGLFADSIQSEPVIAAHWGKCAKIAGRFIAQIAPDSDGFSWYWFHLDQKNLISDRNS